MPTSIAEICLNEQKRETMILELLNKADKDKQFSIKWITVDNLVYLSLKPRSPVFCDQGRQILEGKGIKVLTSKNKDELWIKKSQSSQLIKLMDDWKNACKLIELLNSNLFEKRIFEQCALDEKGIVLNFRPFDLVIFRRILPILNGSVKEDGRIYIPLELIDRKDVDFKELKKTANLYADKMNRVIHLAKTHGKAKLVYTDSALKITFKDEPLLNSFVEALPKCKRTENPLEVTCLYDDILDGVLPAVVKQIEPATSPDIVDNKTKCIASFQKALEPLIPNYKNWRLLPDCIETDLGPQYLVCIKTIGYFRIRIETVAEN